MVRGGEKRGANNLRGFKFRVFLKISSTSTVSAARFCFRPFESVLDLRCLYHESQARLFRRISRSLTTEATKRDARDTSARTLTQRSQRFLISIEFQVSLWTCDVSIVSIFVGGGESNEYSPLPNVLQPIFQDFQQST